MGDFTPDDGGGYGGGGQSTSGDPWSDSSVGGGWNDPYTSIGPYGSPNAPPPWSPPDYSPPQNPGYYNQNNSGSHTASRPTPPDPWSGIPGAVHDQAVSLVDTFYKVAGAPAGYDANQRALELAKAMPGLTSSSYQAYEWLFEHTLWHAENTPWARFGLDRDSYNQTTSKLNYVYADWTGQQLGDASPGSADQGNPDAALWQAIRGGWDPNQIRNFAMYGDPNGGTTLRAEAQYGGSMPWLSQGQTFTQAQQAYQAFEGFAPSSRDDLAAFWRFGSSLKTLGGGGEAHTVEAENALTRTKQSQVR